MKQWEKLLQTVSYCQKCKETFKDIDDLEQSQTTTIEQFKKTGRPAIVSDFVEGFRFLVDDFQVQYCQKLTSADFTAKTKEWAGKKSKLIYLKKSLTDELTVKLHDYFRRMVKVPRIMRGNQQELETLINEEALLFAKYLRNEIPSWHPRVVPLG